MDFWKYCEKCQGVIGFTNVLNNIQKLYECYVKHMTVGEACDLIVPSKENNS